MCSNRILISYEVTVTAFIIANICVKFFENLSQVSRCFHEIDYPANDQLASEYLS